MLKIKKYIGGDFDASASKSFEVSESQMDNFFPATVVTLKRNFYETATDSFAAIIRQIYSEDQRPVQLWYPAHYCIETIMRLKLKSTGISLNDREYHTYGEIAYTPGSTNVLLYNHFNGYNDNANKIIERFSNNNWYVIEDFVHAPLDIRKTKAHYSFNSLRKLSDVEVSVCYGLKEDILQALIPSEYFIIKKEAARLKGNFILGEAVSEEQYLLLFRKAESLLNRKEISLVYNSELNRVFQIDWQGILEKRKENYQVFKSMITSLDEVQVLSGEYMYMALKASKRNLLKENMFNQGIFPVIHWPDSLDSIKNEVLSFHIDQRYEKKDITRTCDAITSFYSS